MDDWDTNTIALIPMKQPWIIRVKEAHTSAYKYDYTTEIFNMALLIII